MLLGTRMKRESERQGNLHRKPRAPPPVRGEECSRVMSTQARLAHCLCADPSVRTRCAVWNRG